MVLSVNRPRGFLPHLASERKSRRFRRHVNRDFVDDLAVNLQPPAEGRTEAQKKTRVPREVPENASFSEIMGILKNDRVAGTGFEPATSRL